MDACVHVTSKPCPHGKPQRALGRCREAGAGTSLRERWDVGGQLSQGAEGAVDTGVRVWRGGHTVPTNRGSPSPMAPAWGTATLRPGSLVQCPSRGLRGRGGAGSPCVQNGSRWSAAVWRSTALAPTQPPASPSAWSCPTALLVQVLAHRVSAQHWAPLCRALPSCLPR